MVICPCGSLSSGQRQRLGQQLLDHRRIIVAGEDRIDHGSQPRDAVACIARRIATPSATSVLS
jgi:hypothetical protein